jgi:hypothetical protein
MAATEKDHLEGEIAEIQAEPVAKGQPRGTKGKAALAEPTHDAIEMFSPETGVAGLLASQIELLEIGFDLLELLADGGPLLTGTFGKSQEFSKLELVVGCTPQLFSINPTTARLRPGLFFGGCQNATNRYVAP